MRVAVIGAGVIGVTSALAVAEAFPDLEVTIFAEKLSPETTGDGSAGLWGPYLLGNTPAENIRKWAADTHRWLEELWTTGQAAEAGICLLPVYRFTKQESLGNPIWFDLVYGARKLTEEDLCKMNEEQKTNYKAGWQFLTYTSEPVRLLPWLMNKLSAMGGTIKRKKIEDFGELIDAGYNFIINCTGLGAAELVKNDPVLPLRGQVSRVKAPWAFHSYLVDDDDGNYVIPNIDSVVLGGTHQENDYDCTVRAEDSDFIHDGCSKIIPALQNVELIEEWVGLRPGRSEVRLESAVHRTPGGKEINIIHNYGHGGSGVTLSWGCALHVVEILRILRSHHLHSKL